MSMKLSIQPDYLTEQSSNLKPDYGMSTEEAILKI